MMAPCPVSLPVPRDDPSAVEEWDDASCLARAVERLDAERRDLRELGNVRRCVTTSTGLALAFLGAITLSALVPTLEPLMAAVMVGLLRGAIVEGIDQEIADRQVRVGERLKELSDRLERSDWLLLP